MAWQDWVLTIGSFIFSIALIPSLISKDKPAVSTSLSTGIILVIYSYVYYTLNLYLSMVTVAITGVIWLTLAWQKWQQERARGSR